MIGDLRQIQIQISGELGKWEDNVNSGRIGSLLEHFYYAWNRRQAKSPVLVPLPSRGREILSRHVRPETLRKPENCLLSNWPFSSRTIDFGLC